jgi:hypothetical protein
MLVEEGKIILSILQPSVGRQQRQKQKRKDLEKDKKGKISFCWEAS